MNVIEKRLDEITPYENNPRINDAAVEYVANSLREFGWKQPIVIDADGVIIAGHTRFKAAKKLGWKTAPCVIADDLTDEQIRAYRLADNKTGEMAEWDFEALEQELDALTMDMSQFGFLDETMKELEAEEDNFTPVLPETPKAKQGDIYKLGRHRLMCGDSTSVIDVQSLCRGEQIDLLLTDPPYNVDYNGSAGKIKNDNMGSSQFREFLSSALMAAKSVMKPGAAFHIWHAETEGYNFRGACADVGFKCRQQLIWVKSSQTLGRQDFQRMYEGVLTGDAFTDEEMEQSGYEACLYGWKDGKGHKWYKKRKEKDVLFFDKPIASKEHPTMKPVKLFDYEMRCNTKPGDNVLDIFSGSGTTVIAAEQNERNAFCMELDPRYVDVIVSRWEQLTGEKAVLVNV